MDEERIARGLVKPVGVIFWAPAKQFQIANFIKEEKQAGHLVRMEEPIRFAENIFVTEDKKAANFVRNSESFKAGIIRECESMAEAQALSRDRGIRKRVKYVVTQDTPATEHIDVATK